jgi:hypothetical protein
MTLEPAERGPSDVVIAAADTVLGQLQRGRGAGFLAALAMPPETVWPLLVECITHDPRWDRQVERRGEMYADLMMTSGMDLAPVEALVRAHDPNDRGMSEFQPFEVVSELAKRGDERSLDLLRELVRDSGDWPDSFDVLMDIGTPAAIESLDEILLSRAQDDQELERHLPWDEDDGPWATWRLRHPRIDAGMRARRAEIEREAAEAAQLDGLSIEELLLSKARDHGNPRAGEFVWDRIAKIVRPSDLPVIVRHLDSAEIRFCRRALGALRKISSKEALAALRAFIESNPVMRERCMAYVGRALCAQPAELVLDLGRSWFEQPDWPYRAWGQNILSEHATVDEVPLLERALAQCCTDADQSYRACAVLEAFGRLPATGHFPDIERAYLEARYSLVRQEAARAMQVTDPHTFADGFAYECLWDCRSGIQEIGIAAVDPALPHVRARLIELGSRPLRDEDVAREARARLASC